jgi:hypothetical protein
MECRASHTRKYTRKYPKTESGICGYLYGYGVDRAVAASFSRKFSFLIGEFLKIKNGKIYRIEALVLNAPYGCRRDGRWAFPITQNMG